MKENKFLDGISHIEEDVVEGFVKMDNRLQNTVGKRKAKKLFMRIGAIAACVALIFGVVALMKTNGNSVIFDATVSPEKLVGSNAEFLVGGSGSSGAASEPLHSGFYSGAFSVKARVVENYTDTYYKLISRLNQDTDTAPLGYRVIKMECLEGLNSEYVAKYFLYLIKESAFVDMSGYDSLLISMSQIGAENYVMKNANKSQMEAFDLPVFTDSQDRPDLGSIIAFTDGVFDESLWENNGWHSIKYYLDYPEYAISGYHVVNRGDSEETVISNIMNSFHYNTAPTMFTLDFSTQAAKEAIEYVAPFTNGVFSQEYQRYYSNAHKTLLFTRYINGCQTEEQVIIDLETEEVTYSEVRYTKEDMQKIENIAYHLAQKAKEYKDNFPTPPHTDSEGKKLIEFNLYAWYAKVDGKVYGVIKTSWCYEESREPCNMYYYDAAFTLYDVLERTATEIEREELREIVGLRNVGNKEYGVPIERPLE